MSLFFCLSVVIIIIISMSTILCCIIVSNIILVLLVGPWWLVVFCTHVHQEQVCWHVQPLFSLVNRDPVPVNSNTPSLLPAVVLQVLLGVITVATAPWQDLSFCVDGIVHVCCNTPCQIFTVCFGQDTFLAKQFDRLSHVLMRIIRCRVVYLSSQNLKQTTVSTHLSNVQHLFRSCNAKL